MTPDTDITCYRHPDRPTGLSCTECGRPICGECSISAAVGQRCPQCVAKQGRQETVTMRTMRRASWKSAPLTFGFIAVAVAIHVLFLFAPAVWADLADRLALFTGQVRDGAWYQMFTLTLLHGSVAHLGFNMYALFLLGPQLEIEMGRLRYTGLFLASAAAGSAFAVVLGGPDDVAVGASGALFGLFGIWSVSAYRRRRTRMGRAQLSNIGFTLLINAAIPFLVPQVSWQAHLGGYLAGLLYGAIYLRKPDRRHLSLHIATAVALIVGSVLVTQVI